MVRARNIPEWLLEKPIAHRGLHDNSGVLPENSLGSFQAAIRAGVPIEIDVHLLADQQVVIFHDHDLQRMTGVGGKIADQTSESLRALRLLDTEEPIPLLSEALREIDGAAPLLIEIKNMHSKVGELEAAVLRVLQDYQGAFAIQSFNAMSVHYVREHAPSLCCGQLSGGRIGVPFARLNQPDFVAYYVGSLTAPLSARLRRSGTPLLAWTITTAAQYARARRFADNYIFEATPTFTPPTLQLQDGKQLQVGK